MRRLLFATLLFLLVSCGGRTTQSNFGGDVSYHAVAKSDIIRTIKLDKDNFENIADYIASVEYIPLDDKRLIGEMTQVVYSDGFYYILDRRVGQILAFDEQGKFVREISHKGRAGNEYIQAWSIDILPQSGDIAIMDNLGSKILIFGRDGKHKHNIEVGVQATDAKFMQSDSTVVYLMSAQQNLGTPLSKYQIAVNSVGNKDYLASYRLRPVQDGYCGDHALVKGSGRLLFKPIFSDSLYVVGQDASLKCAYHIDIPDSAWDRYYDYTEFVNLLDKDNQLFPWIYENENYLIAYTDYAKNLDPNGRMTTIMYDRREDKTHLFHMLDPNSEQDLEHFFGFNVIGVKEDGFICMISPSIIVSCDLVGKIKRGEIKLKNKDFEKAILGVGEDSNPVLTIVKFK